MEEDHQSDLVLRENIQQRIAEIGEERLHNLNVYDDESADIILSIAHILAQFYDGYISSLPNDDLSRLDDRIPDLRQSSENITQNFTEWFAKRKELIDVLNSSAQVLDERFSRFITSRLIGSVLDLAYNIDSIFDKAISHNITNMAFGISRALGVASLLFFKCLPQFAYMGFVSEIFNISSDKISMIKVLKVIKEDRELFSKIARWVEETENLDFNIKQSIPDGLDNSIAKRIESILSSYPDDNKIFVTAVLSSLKSNPDPGFLKNIRPLCKLYKFSKSEAAKEFYDRSLRGAYGMEITYLEIRNDLIQYSLSASEIPLQIVKLGPEIEIKLNSSSSKVDAKDVINVKLKFLPQLCLGVINCFHIYNSYRDLKDGAKHQHSDLLRDMARKATTHRRQMNVFMSRCCGSRLRPLADGTFV